jgi:hypothetical protein
MATSRAPEQWALTKQETITSYEAWRQNLQYTLALDHNFAVFLLEDTTWLRKTSTAPLRGLVNDGEDVPEASRRTAAQKLTHLIGVNARPSSQLLSRHCTKHNR